MSADTSRPVLLGEAPSRSGDRFHRFPLSGQVAQTLCGMAGIPPQESGSRYGRWTWALYERFECRNLIQRWPGAQGQGSALPMAQARAAAEKALPPLDGRVVVLLGARLPRVLGVRDAGFYEWRSARLLDYDLKSGVREIGDPTDLWDEEYPGLPRAQIVAIPHPSGLNRVLNSAVERERAGDVLREALRRATCDTVPVGSLARETTGPARNHHPPRASHPVLRHDQRHT